MFIQETDEEERKKKKNLSGEIRAEALDLVGSLLVCVFLHKFTFFVFPFFRLRTRERERRRKVFMMTTKREKWVDLREDGERGEKIEYPECRCIFLGTRMV